MTKLIDPEKAPKDGRRVLFYLPEGTQERLITAVYDSDRKAWVDRTGDEIDTGIATSAQVVGFDPEGEMLGAGRKPAGVPVVLDIPGHGKIACADLVAAKALWESDFPEASDATIETFAPSGVIAGTSTYRFDEEEQVWVKGK